MALKAVKRGKKGFKTQALHWRRKLALAILGAALVVLVVLLSSGYAVSTDVGCESCHQGYAQAAAESAHAGLECSRCHASGGASGYVVDGLRAMNWLSGSSAATIAPAGFDDAKCLECHTDIFEVTRESRGIAVRHADFQEAPCKQCHSGTAHAVEGRWYRPLAMDDCMGCHRSSPTNVSSCDTCHVPDPAAERRDGNTVWRATHGSAWQKTHGMGDLDGCTACHTPVYCIDCHGVRVPHADEWLQVHGKQVVATGRTECETCHEPAWCTDCHQIEMPHYEGFIKQHGPEAETLGEQACYRCHQKPNCDNCHFQSSHPNLPTVGMIHEFE